MTSPRYDAVHALARSEADVAIFGSGLSWTLNFADVRKIRRGDHQHSEILDCFCFSRPSLACAISVTKVGGQPSCCGRASARRSACAGRCPAQAELTPHDGTASERRWGLGGFSCRLVSGDEDRDAGDKSKCLCTDRRLAAGEQFGRRPARARPICTRRDLIRPRPDVPGERRFNAARGLARRFG